MLRNLYSLHTKQYSPNFNMSLKFAFWISKQSCVRVDDITRTSFVFRCKIYLTWVTYFTNNFSHDTIMWLWLVWCQNTVIFSLHLVRKVNVFFLLVWSHEKTNLEHEERRRRNRICMFAPLLYLHLSLPKKILVT